MEFNLPERAQNSHKGTFGKVLNIAGSRYMPGAAYLSSVAALKIGAGYCFLAAENNVINAVAAQTQNVVFLPEFSWVDHIENFDVISIGCGLSTSKDAKWNVEKVLKYSSKQMEATGDVIIDGIDDLKVSYGGCCKPIKGDQIVGYISKGNGITIHRKNCYNICNVNDRIISAKWNPNSSKKYVTNVLIYAEKKDNVLLEIISKTTSLNIGIKSVNTINNLDYNVFDIDILVEDLDKLNKYISVIEQLPFVNSIERGNK